MFDETLYTYTCERCEKLIEVSKQIQYERWRETYYMLPDPPDSRFDAGDRLAWVYCDDCDRSFIMHRKDSLETKRKQLKADIIEFLKFITP